MSSAHLSAAGLIAAADMLPKDAGSARLGLGQARGGRDRHTEFMPAQPSAHIPARLKSCRRGLMPLLRDSARRATLGPPIFPYRAPPYLRVAARPASRRDTQMGDAR